jgi:hypothetical protein
MCFRVRRYVGAPLVVLLHLLTMHMTINVKSHEYDRWEKVTDLFLSFEE